ncbi:MAG: hypothetical protein JW939_01235, partial [Candidatus Thermoplasmatota archaeon]|nr:hypothetical protein [Candidatus Thermoplasmatota archaeon]
LNGDSIGDTNLPHHGVDDFPFIEKDGWLKRFDVNITSPSNNSVIRGNIMINVIFTGSFIKLHSEFRAIIEIDTLNQNEPLFGNYNWVNANLLYWTFYWNTTQCENGIHTIYARSRLKTSVMNYVVVFVNNTLPEDTDGDGIPDIIDSDDDNDGLLDIEEDFDMDGFLGRNETDPKNYDTDGDTYGDKIDAFPRDPLEWGDTDLDGIGDNKDLFPNDPSEWKDVDADGYGDNRDVFPLDPSEWNDTDGDRIGDNSDTFPKDPFEWNDTDNDGIGDNGDAFPTDPAASIDTDGDGYPDRWNEGKSEKDSTTGLKLDEYPDNPTKWEKEDNEKKMTTRIIVVIVVLILFILGLCILFYSIWNRRRPTPNEE